MGSGPRESPLGVGPGCPGLCLLLLVSEGHVGALLPEAGCAGDSLSRWWPGVSEQWQLCLSLLGG
jgi:hypothetical protein